MELLAAGGMGNEALTELLRVEVRWCLGLISYSAYIYNNTHHTIITTTTPPPPPPPQAGGPDDEEGEGKSKAITTSSSGPGGLSVIGQESLSSKQWEARRRQQGVAAVDRLLWAAGGAVEGMGAGAKRVAVVSRLLAVLGAGAARTPGGGEGEEMEGPTLPVVQQEGQEGYRAKANVGAIAALASSQGAVGEWLGGWVRVKGGRGGECGRLASLRLTPKKGQNTHTRPRPHPSLPPTSKPTTPAPPPLPHPHPSLPPQKNTPGHALSYLVEDYAGRRELADRLLYELFLDGLMEQEELEGEEVSLLMLFFWMGSFWIG